MIAQTTQVKVERFTVIVDWRTSRASAGDVLVECQGSILPCPKSCLDEPTQNV
jgi:hypothetical protein